jgi:hypothetical protein
MLQITELCWIVRRSREKTQDVRHELKVSSRIHDEIIRDLCSNDIYLPCLTDFDFECMQHALESISLHISLERFMQNLWIPS